VPLNLANQVPQLPGVYVIFSTQKDTIEDRIIDIGMAGLRKGQGLRGRIASAVAHSASENMADDIANGTLPDALQIVWINTDTQPEAKGLEEALITLFQNEFGRRPMYNGNGGHVANYGIYQPTYDALKLHIGQL